MGGGFDFVSDIIDTGSDFVGDVFDTVGDIGGDIIDVGGDILGDIGDVVGDLDLGDALQAFVLSGGNPYAAAVAATGIDESLGFNPGSFMSGDFGSFGDLGGFEPGSVGFDLGTPDFSGIDTSGIGDFSDYLSSAEDFANLPNLGKSLGDIVDYTDLVNQGGGDFMDYLQTGVEQGGDFTDYLSKLEDFNKLPDVPKGIGDVVQGGLDDAIEIYKKYGKPAADIAKLITSYQAGKLSKKQQEDLNRRIQQQLDEQRAKQAGFQSKIDTGQLAKLDIRRGTTPTVAGYTPIFARGGQVRNKYNVGGITELMAGLSLPSIEEILGTYKKYKDPISELLKYGTSYYAGKLSKKQQEELNRKLQASFDEQKRKQEEFQNKIDRGELAKLDIRRGTTPTVRMAMGGLTNFRPRYNMGIMGLNR
jgi:F0F1-type ATP synthase delta subunit